MTVLASGATYFIESRSTNEHDHSVYGSQLRIQALYPVGVRRNRPQNNGIPSTDRIQGGAANSMASTFNTSALI